MRLIKCNNTIGPHNFHVMFITSQKGKTGEKIILNE